MTSQPVPYKVLFSRRRSIGIIVSPDKGVIVKAPYRTSPITIDRFVASKTSWIKKHLQSYSKMVRLNNSAVYDGGKILFRGKEYILNIEPSSASSVKKGETVILVGIKDPKNEALKTAVLDSWYKRNAEENITAMMNDILIRYGVHGFRPSGISLRTMRRRWGSCSSRGKITINTELIKLDDRFTEYVILHELCHLKHHNHGNEFYALLSEVCPCWKEIRKELKSYIA